MAPGTKIDLVVLQGGSEKSMSLTLGELPNQKEAKNEPSNDNGSATADIGKLGLTLAPASRVNGAGDQGVVVTNVDGSGVAAEHGFSTGDVILEISGKQVSSPGDVRNAIGVARKDGRKNVLMRVKSGDNTRFVALPIGQG
jgi:serine protease Do